MSAYAIKKKKKKDKGDKKKAGTCLFLLRLIAARKVVVVYGATPFHEINDGNNHHEIKNQAKVDSFTPL